MRSGLAPATALLLAAYLLASAPLLLFGGSGPRVPLLLLHLVGAAGLAVLAARRSRGGVGWVERAVLDFAPLLAAPLLYAELPALMEGMPGPVVYHDPAISGIEARLFGGQPAFDWAGAWPSVAVSEVLHASYACYYPMIYAAPALLWLGITGSGPTEEARAADFGETVLALQACFFACFVAFVAFPVQGPRYLGVPAGIPDGPIRRLVLLLLQSGSSRGAAFPSAHVAVTVTQVAMALKFQRGVGWISLVIAVGLTAGAVYGGFHYAVDTIAGGLLGLAVVPLAGALRRRADLAASGFTSTPGAA